MYMDMGYLGLIVVTLIIGCAATAWVNRQLHKYQRVPISNGLTGAEAARQMLSYYGIHNVPVQRGGRGQDFFDPRTNSVTLSPEAYDGRSITATATACHEVGHACQFAEGYAPMKVRGSLVPVVNLASNAWVFLLMIGIFMQIAGLITLAIAVPARHVAGRVQRLGPRYDLHGHDRHAGGRALRRGQRAARVRAHLRCCRAHLHPAASVAARPARGITRP